MGERLEGILSEAILDQIASDLGVDPDDMRKHPFFRVLKGSVLLTYPLRVAPNSCWKFQEPIVFSQLNPGAGYHTILDTTEYVRLLFLAHSHDDDPNSRGVYWKITIDGEVIEGQFPTPHTDVHYTTLKAATIATLGITSYTSVARFDLEGRSVKVEIKCTSLLGGKTLEAFVVYEMLE